MTKKEKCEHLSQCASCFNDLQAATKLGKEAENKRILDKLLERLKIVKKYRSLLADYPSGEQYWGSTVLLSRLKREISSLRLKGGDKK